MTLIVYLLGLGRKESDKRSRIQSQVSRVTLAQYVQTVSHYWLAAVKEQQQQQQQQQWQWSTGDLVSSNSDKCDCNKQRLIARVSGPLAVTAAPATHYLFKEWSTKCAEIISRGGTQAPLRHGTNKSHTYCTHSVMRRCISTWSAWCLCLQEKATSLKAELSRSEYSQNPARPVNGQGKITPLYIYHILYTILIYCIVLYCVIGYYDTYIYIYIQPPCETYGKMLAKSQGQD